MKGKKKLSLAAQIFIGLGLGIIAGLIFLATGKADWAVSVSKYFFASAASCAASPVCTTAAE